MKNILTLLLPFLFLFLLNSFSSDATNVSGGIYSNTTWTLANSPYIVTDTVVVFPGVTLTIEPGAMVKFENGKYMEIRQGTLIAAGTVTDSITFTSNSISPTLGIYRGILFTNAVAITIDYCHFEYADQALNLPYGNNIPLTIDHSYFFRNNKAVNINNSSVTLVIQHSDFYLNNYCIPESNYPVYIKHTSFYNNNNCLGYFPGNVSASFLDSCIFMNNQFGVDIFDSGSATNCIFNNNGIALFIDDETRYKVSNSIFCNDSIGISMRAHQSHDTIINCNFSQNHIAVQSFVSPDYFAGNILSENDTACIGLAIDSMFNNYIFHNTVGVLYNGYPPIAFFNNYICNNIFNIVYTSSANGSIPPVCFCETDSATIRSKIYDGYVNIAYGLLSFTPFVNCDSSAITSLPPINCQTVVLTDVEENATHSASTFEIFPNPATDHLAIKSKNILHAQVKIFNMLGELKYFGKIEKQSNDINISNLSDGIYFIEVNDGTGSSCEKFVKQRVN